MQHYKLPVLCCTSLANNNTNCYENHDHSIVTNRMEDLNPAKAAGSKTISVKGSCNYGPTQFFQDYKANSKPLIYNVSIY